MTSTIEQTFTDEDVSACIRVLRAIEADRAHLVRMNEERRRELLVLAGMVAKPERHEVVRLARALKRTTRASAREKDRNAVERSGQRARRRARAYSPLWFEPAVSETAPLHLSQERACYVCKQPFSKMHRFYDSMCEECGDFNYAKRAQTADLSGHHALITGARVKIGYEAALKMLRAGAHVIVTTRFPLDAAARYSREPDYSSFSTRLKIYGLDLRHTPSVEIFARFLLDRLPRLDYVLNNACQTVRRPAAFFQHLLAKETQPLSSVPDHYRASLAGHFELLGSLTGRMIGPGSNEVQRTTSPADGLTHSAALSQMRFLEHDFDDRESLFPAGLYDLDRQQVDLRQVNSWRLRLHEVETPELLEVQLINAIAPFILTARLKPLMIGTRGQHKHVVNVSAMEGQFYRIAKTDKHPHTNMAKAALNMMTRTSAPDFVQDGIHMNAVDTGWVTDEDPALHAARKANLGFAPPLDIVDGAARIVDPIFAGSLTGTHLWGQFLKDYKPARW